MRDFKVVFLSDCSASFSPEEQGDPKKFRQALSGYGLAHVCRAHLERLKLVYIRTVQPQPETPESIITAWQADMVGAVPNIGIGNGAAPR